MTPNNHSGSGTFAVFSSAIISKTLKVDKSAGCMGVVTSVQGKEGEVMERSGFKEEERRMYISRSLKGVLSRTIVSASTTDCGVECCKGT